MGWVCSYDTVTINAEGKKGKISMGKSFARWPLRRSRERWVDNINL